jgi:serine/threonine protein kinase/WD40 repeat protein
LIGTLEKPLIADLLSRLNIHDLRDLKWEFDLVGDNAGRISCAQFIAGVRNLLHFPLNPSFARDKSQIESMIDLFEQLDYDKDGYITWADFTSIVLEITSFSEFAIPEYNKRGHVIKGLPFTDKHRINGAEQRLERVVFDEAGNRLLCIEKAGSFSILDGTTFEVLCEKRNERNAILLCGCWIPDNELVAIAGNDRTVSLYETVHYHLVKVLDTAAPLMSLYYSDFENLCFGGDSLGNLYSWDPSKQTKGFQMLFSKAHADFVLVILHILDLGVLVTGSADRTVRIWDLKDNSCRSVRRGHHAGVCHLAYSPHFRFILSAGYGREILVWNTFAEFHISKLNRHEMAVVGLQAMEDSPQAFSMDEGGLICIWDLRTMSCAQVLQADYFPLVNALVCPANGRILTVGNYVTYFDRVAVENSERFDQPLSGVEYCFLQNIVVGCAGRKVYVWRTDNGEMQALYVRLGICELSSMKLSHEGRDVIVGDLEGTIWVYNLRNGDLLHKTKVLKDGIQSIHLLPRRPKKDLRKCGPAQAVSDSPLHFALAIGYSGDCAVFCYDGEAESVIQFNCSLAAVAFRKSMMEKARAEGEAAQPTQTTKSSLSANKSMRKATMSKLKVASSPEPLDFAPSEVMRGSPTSRSNDLMQFVGAASLVVPHCYSKALNLFVYALGRSLYAVDTEEGELKIAGDVAHEINCMCFMENLNAIAVFQTVAECGNSFTVMDVMVVPSFRTIFVVEAESVSVVRASHYTEAGYSLITLDAKSRVHSWNMHSLATVFNSHLRRYVAHSDTIPPNMFLYRGRYLCENKTIKGGLNAIRFAYDRELGHNVALKFFADEEEYECETRVLGEVRSPFVIGMHDHFSNSKENLYCICMEKADKSLHDIIHAHGVIPPQLQQMIAVHVATGLQDMHRKAYISSDMKPRNVMQFGSSFKIIDLDNGRAFGEAMPLKYTPNYCPPEMARFRAKKCTSVSAAASFDAWGYGMVLYELLARVPYFDGGEMKLSEEEILDFLAAPNVPENLKVSERNIPNRIFRNVITHCLATNPDKRWTMDEVLQYLENEGYAQQTAPQLSKASFDRVADLSSFSPFNIKTDVVDCVQHLQTFPASIDRVSFTNSPSLVFATAFDEIDTYNHSKIFLCNYRSGKFVGSLPRVSTIRKADATPQVAYTSAGAAHAAAAASARAARATSASKNGPPKSGRSPFSARSGYVHSHRDRERLPDQDKQEQQEAAPTQSESPSRFKEIDIPWSFPPSGAHTLKKQEEIMTLTMRVGKAQRRSPMKKRALGMSPMSQTELTPAINISRTAAVRETAAEGSKTVAKEGAHASEPSLSKPSVPPTPAIGGVRLGTAAVMEAFGMKLAVTPDLRSRVDDHNASADDHEDAGADHATERIDSPPRKIIMSGELGLDSLSPIFSSWKNSGGQEHVSKLRAKLVDTKRSVNDAVYMMRMQIKKEFKQQERSEALRDMLLEWKSPEAKGKAVETGDRLKALASPAKPAPSITPLRTMESPAKDMKFLMTTPRSQTFSEVKRSVELHSLEPEQLFDGQGTFRRGNKPLLSPIPTNAKGSK